MIARRPAVLCLFVASAAEAFAQVPVSEDSANWHGNASYAWIAAPFALFAIVACAWLLWREFARRRWLEQRLGDAEALYRLLAANTDEIVLVIDGAGCVTYASPSVVRSGVWQEAELDGRALLDFIHPAHKGRVAAQLDNSGASVESGAWHEVIALDGTGGEHWFEIQVAGRLDEHGRSRGAVAILRSIAERKALELQLRESERTDPLTGLSNRRAFMVLLQRHLDEQRGGCIALFDLDHFRALNDRYGHVVGDNVLILFARLMRGLVRAEDTVARLGGEKFGVLLPRATPEQAETVCQRILNALSGTARPVGAAIVRVSASAGVGGLAGSIDDALKVADRALHLAKAKGRDRLEMAPRLRNSQQSRW